MKSFIIAKQGWIAAAFATLAFSVSSFAEVKQAPLRLIATAPSSAYHIEGDADGVLWIVIGKNEAGRINLPLPAGAKPGRPAADDSDGPDWPRAFISPDEVWIYAEETHSAPARLYRRAPGTLSDAPRFELAEGFGDMAKRVFAVEAKSPKLHVERVTSTFVAWSEDSARLLLAFNFMAAAPETAPVASFATNWLCYYNTRTNIFELTSRLRAADKGKIDLTLKAQNLPHDVPVLSAEGFGKEGPETPLKERFTKADAKLNQVYAQVLAKLAPEEKEKLRTEERAWLGERETAAWIHAGQMWTPWVEASRLEGQALATEARVADLQKRLGGGVQPAVAAAKSPAAAAAPADDAAPMVDFTGYYQRKKPIPGATFDFTVEQNADGASVSFSAAQNNGSGAAPDADGRGQLDAASVLNFTFEDSFSNEGKGTLKKTNGGYLLQLDVTKVTDARCLKYYGTIELRKTRQ